MFLGINREYLDESLLHMFTEMVVAHIDMLVLGLGRSLGLGNPIQLEGARIVFKSIAIHVGLGTKNYEILLPCFLQQSHDRDDIM